MAKSAPAPRPALTKAPDAGVHPVSGRAPAGGNVVRSTSFRPSKGGATTADAVVNTGDQRTTKLVNLTVQVPKPMRKQLRSIAKQRGMSVDEVVSAILAGSLPR